jgi:hypothetical protein
MALSKAFFDDTGTDQESSVVAIGGFVGSDTAWEKIEPNWESILGEVGDRGVKSMHTSEAIAQDGQFSLIDKPRLDYILTGLSKTLGSEELTPFFSAVVKRDWEAVVRDEDFLHRFPSPISLCFENIIQKLWKWGKGNVDGELIVPMFAYEKSQISHMAKIGELYGEYQWYRDVLGALAFDYPYRVIGLQAADLLSHQMRWDVEKGKETNALLWSTNKKIVRGNLFDKDGLLRTMKRFKDAGYPLGPVGLSE